MSFNKNGIDGVSLQNGRKVNTQAAPVCNVVCQAPVALGFMMVAAV